MWQGWVNLILGIWLIISGFVSSLQTPANLIVVGILATVFGFWAYKMWQGIANGILGLWTLLSGLVFHLLNPTNFIIVGLLMGVFGAWEGYSQRKQMQAKTA